MVSCFCCNGVVLSTEEILSTFGEGGGPRDCEEEGPGVCGVWLLSFAVMKQSFTEENLPIVIMEEVLEFVKCGYLHCIPEIPNFREIGPRVCEV